MARSRSQYNLHCLPFFCIYFPLWQMPLIITPSNPSTFFNCFSFIMTSNRIISIWAIVSTALVIAAAGQQVPCYFIFGDSLVDNGNNNNLVTLAKVNYLPYGIDFPDGPTGRFTNGRTIVDVIARLLGFDTPIPPFTTAEGQEIIKGVNYGSGAAGILDETGTQLGENFSFNRQLQNHQTTISRLPSLLRNTTLVQEYLSKCLYTVGIGSNDYINNYFMPQNYSSSKLYTPEQYASLLIQQYSQQLTTLYNYGARKIAVFGLGPIGCTPAEIGMYGKNQSGCVDFVNAAVQLFNNRLESLVGELNSNLTSANFIYINVFSILSEQIASLGLRFLTEPCCKVSSIGQCIPGEAPCILRALYAFWDNFHPTETVNLATGPMAYIALLPLVLIEKISMA